MALVRQLLKNSMLGLWVVDNMKYTQTFAEAYRQVRLRKELSEDHEVSMAVSQLKTIQDNLNQLMSVLQSKGSDYELEAWVQSKITSANDKMTSATDYMKNSPSVSEAVKEEEEDEKSDKKVSKDEDKSKDEVASLKAQIQKLELELKIEKDASIKPEPNPDTGEVPLRTGVAAALLDKKGPKPDVDKQSKTKVELSKKKSKIEINPDVDMGVFSGGNKMNQGNLY